MPAIWPFQIREQLLDASEWKTDIIPTYNGEQRLAMRHAPRETLIYSHTLTQQAYQGARALVRADPTAQFQIPDWRHFVKVDAVAAGSNVFVDYGEPWAELADGDTVLIWQGPTQYEQATIAAVDSADGLTLASVAGNYVAPYIMPLRAAIAPDGLQSDRSAGPVVQSQIEFLLTDSRDQGHNPYPLYLTYPVITDCPVIASGSFAEPLAHDLDVFDPIIGYPDLTLTRAPSVEQFAIRWHVITRADIYRLRRFFHYCRGKWKAFWLPSFTRDLQLVANIGAASTTMTVKAPGGITDLGMDIFDLDIDGRYYRRITSYSVSGSNLILHFSGALGSTIKTDARISFLRKLRFDADRLLFTHQAKSGAFVQVPCVEVP